MLAELADDLHQPVEHLGVILELRLARHHRALADAGAALEDRVLELLAGDAGLPRGVGVVARLGIERGRGRAVAAAIGAVARRAQRVEHQLGLGGLGAAAARLAGTRLLLRVGRAGGRRRRLTALAARRYEEERDHEAAHKLAYSAAAARRLRPADRAVIVRRAVAGGSRLARPVAQELATPDGEGWLGRAPAAAPGHLAGGAQRGREAAGIGCVLVAEAMLAVDREPELAPARRGPRRRIGRTGAAALAAARLRRRTGRRR